MDPKQSKPLATTILIVGVVLAVIIILAGPSETPEERVAEIRREILAIEEEIQEISDSELSQEERGERTQELQEDLLSLEEELKSIDEE